MSETRQCTICLIVKPITDFHADSRKILGRKFQCGSCCNERTKKLEQIKRKAGEIYARQRMEEMRQKERG